MKGILQAGTTEIIKENCEIIFNNAFNHIHLTSVIILLSINSKALFFFTVIEKIKA